MSNQQAHHALDALGDHTRRAIIEELRGGPVAVGELAARLTFGRPNVSKHLRVLTQARLVVAHRQGTRNLYALAPDGLREVQRWLVHQWDDVLDSFAAHIDQYGKREADDDSTPAS
ncbi:MAG: ArsR/SmtB family transcription factor [Actinomycetaceae bacterium]